MVEEDLIEPGPSHLIRESRRGESEIYALVIPAPHEYGARFRKESLCGKQRGDSYFLQEWNRHGEQ